jgi:cobyrinic acid a,c-diamide synthase
LALGTVQPEADSRFVTWALLNALTRGGYQAQHFHSRCSFGGVDGALAAAGLESHHLDSWLMRPELCRELFQRACRDCDVAVVEGSYAPAATETGQATGGRLDPLCQWLGLVRIAVLDVSQLSGCRLPPRPTVDALVLDRVKGEEGFFSWQTVVESLWRIPVVGGLDELPEERAAVAAMQPGGRVLPETCDRLGQSLERYTRLEPIIERGQGREQPEFCGRPLDELCRTFGSCVATVAIAYDDVFRCHFPDVHDVLELLGARVVDFSPLADESLPPGVDLVFLGCGRPDLFAERLADNHCMRAALQQHVRAGGRIYAEGAGAAYLCQSLETPCGTRVGMAGVLPATARLSSTFVPLEPVELTLEAASWLGAANTSLRGYRNRNWQITPLGKLTHLTPLLDGCGELFAHQRVIASCVHLNFAAQLHVLHSLVGAASLAATP